MAEIPDDRLKELYDDVSYKASFNSDYTMRADELKSLIERIDRAEAENTRLKAPVSHQEYKQYAHKLENGYYYTEAQVNALIASRASKEGANELVP